MTTGIETMTFSTPGQEPVTITGKEFEDAVDRLAGSQLTLDVGGEIGEYMVSEFKISGSLASRDHELDREEKVYVRVINDDGELLLSARAWISQVGFETKPASDTAPKHTIRKHTIKLA